MMRVLLDTHAFLWRINDDPQLSDRARMVMRNTENTLYLSAASGWEIAVKSRIGKLELPQSPHLLLWSNSRTIGSPPCPYSSTMRYIPIRFQCYTAILSIGC
jgi:PIN domain nuclease of toxin-antitoxin system